MGLNLSNTQIAPELGLNPDDAQRMTEPLRQGITDEYNIDRRLTEWGFDHRTVGHRRGEYARDEDGDGFYEIHVNTAEDFWSLLRSWLRPHRGISQEKLPLCLGFFQCVHNVRIRSKGLLRPLLELLVA